ncbi:genetic competence negative regulator [Bacillus sp. V3B]|uniref:genetic competence negative regulator n=1 Tax=Bacillus sp. V3B TaxID=2804915 RepID=UPI00210B48B2|nr:genetic competence negative regulator [Bacillus sp. V3B]MCQ6273851.1 genetic competence negative regulator [Bacillus sp. V3B]
MRLERLNYNKIKIFLSLDDLFDRGLTKEDIWKDSLKWHQLFHDMIEEASEAFDVDIHGSVAVEIFSMQAQGMVMIVTMEEQEQEQEQDVFGDSFIDMQVTMEGNVEILFEILDFEHVIQLAKRLSIIGFSGGTLYSMNNEYYFLIDNVCSDIQTQIATIMAEYGNPSFISIYVIQEYGKMIIKEHAVSQIMTYFQ